MKRQERKKITSDELHDFGQTISCHELFMSIVKSAKLVGEVKDKNNNFLIMKITIKNVLDKEVEKVIGESDLLEQFPNRFPKNKNLKD